jgi:hypothetical protein
MIGFFDIPFLNQFTAKRNGLKKYFNRRHFFLSFGDSFLYLVKSFNLNDKDAYILLPEFYCPETAGYFGSYLKPIFYKINPDFSVNKDSYFSLIKNLRPKIIVNYCYTGFNLSPEETNRLKLLINDSTIIIEDYAHRLINPDKLFFINENHFYIDSIRKNTFLQGSHLVSSNNKLIGPFEKINFYKIKCTFLQFVKVLFDCFGYLFSYSGFYSVSGLAFEKHDKIIGNYHCPTLGDHLSFWLYNRLDLKRIQQQRNNLSVVYTEHLKTINNSLITCPAIQAVQTVEFNYFPLLVEPKIREQLIDYLDKKNIFAETLWEHNDYKSLKPEVSNYLYDRLLILPLNQSVKEADVIYLSKQINLFLSNQKNEST